MNILVVVLLDLVVSWLEGEKEILQNLLLKSGVYIENIFFFSEK